MVEGPAYSLGAGPRADMDQILARARNGLIDYGLDAPKHEFLNAVTYFTGPRRRTSTLSGRWSL
jgi:hypothetical protein